MNHLQRTIMTGLILVISALEFGCGEHETNVPAVKLTASTVTSQTDATVHTHSVTIPFTDVSASPTTNSYQYRSSASNGHSHVIALSKQQVIDINNGMRLVITSSAPDSGTTHTHSWVIQGGELLYDKNCYNCHSNDNRGRAPMNVSFNGNQTDAIMNPGGAPTSTTAAAIPDPGYMPSATVSVYGAALYAANCAACHGAQATSAKQNRTFTQIKAAISNNSGGMSSFSGLTDSQLQAIATALAK